LYRTQNLFRKNEVCWHARLKYQSLIESYLCNRFQYVEIKYNSHNENNIIVKSQSRANEFGVPQSSKVGPRIFNFYANDMDHFVSESKVVRFADDTTAIIIADTLEELEQKAQLTINQVENYCRTNRLILNPNKTTYVYFRPPKHDLININLNVFHKPICVSNTTKMLDIH
jgi:hypothetical protein